MLRALRYASEPSKINTWWFDGFHPTAVSSDEMGSEGFSNFTDRSIFSRLRRSSSVSFFSINDLIIMTMLHIFLWPYPKTKTSKNMLGIGLASSKNPIFHWSSCLFPTLRKRKKEILWPRGSKVKGTGSLVKPRWLKPRVSLCEVWLIKLSPRTRRGNSAVETSGFDDQMWGRRRKISADWVETLYPFKKSTSMIMK